MRIPVPAEWLLLLLVSSTAVEAQDQAITDPGVYRNRLAEIELMVSVDRDFDGASLALADLDQRISADIWKVMVEPETAATRKRIEQAIAAARQDESAELEASIGDAIRRDDSATLEALGARAVTALRRSFDSTGDGPVGRLAPESRLMWLCRLDEPSAWELLADDPLVLGADSAPWVLGVVMNYGLRWRDVPFRRPEPERPDWLDWIARLLEHPRTLAQFAVASEGSANDLVQAVRFLASREATTPKLATALTVLIDASHASVAAAIVRALNVPWHPEIQPILEHAVRDPRDVVRRAAAGLLVAADVSPGLRSRVADPDIDVRLRVVESLGKRTRLRNQWGGRNENDKQLTEAVPPATDPESRDLIGRLAADPDPAVREAVARLLVTLDPPAHDEAYLALASDPDVQVRSMMADVAHPDSALRERILVSLAGDAELRVVQAVDTRLRRAHDWSRGDSWLIRVLQVRLGNTSVPLADHDLGRLTAYQEPRSELTRLMLTSGDAGLVDRVSAAYFNDRGRVLKDDTLAEWCRLAGRDLARLLAVLDTRHPAAVGQIADKAIQEGLADDAPDAVEPLARDATRSLRSRLALCALTLHTPNAERIALLLELLGNPALGAGWVRNSDDYNLVSTVVPSIPAPARNAVILAVLETVALHEDLALMVAMQVALDEPDGAPAARFILDRYVTQERASDLLQRCLRRLGLAPEYSDVDLLQRALHQRSASVALTAVWTIGRVRNPGHIPLLREALDPSWLADGGTVSPTDVALAAVTALQGYMSDEAAAVLIDAAATSPSAKVRDAALVAVEAIGRYRDALAAWQRRTSGSAGRDAAIARLAEIAGDPQRDWAQRAESVRGLGTLQAVEHLPLIIEALLDPHTQVRDAAREALQRINEWRPAAPPATEPAVAPTPAGGDAPPPGP